MKKVIIIALFATILLTFGCVNEKDIEEMVNENVPEQTETDKNLFVIETIEQGSGEDTKNTKVNDNANYDYEKIIPEKFISESEALTITEGKLLHMEEYDERDICKAYLSPSGYMYWIYSFAYGKIPKGQTDFEVETGYKDYFAFITISKDYTTQNSPFEFILDVDSSDIKYRLYVEYDDYDRFENVCYAVAQFEKIPYRLKLKPKTEYQNNQLYIKLTQEDGTEYVINSSGTEYVYTDFFEHYLTTNREEYKPDTFQVETDVYGEKGELLQSSCFNLELIYEHNSFSATLRDIN